jgi:hypothetical protein
MVLIVPGLCEDWDGMGEELGKYLLADEYDE